jgi:hypothetical protein
MQLQPGDLVATLAPLTFWPELIICVIAWPLLMAHLFPRTRLADPESRYGRGIPAVFVSLAVVAVPAGAALVGIVRVGTPLDEIGGSGPLTHPVLHWAWLAWATIAT